MGTNSKVLLKYEYKNLYCNLLYSQLLNVKIKMLLLTLKLSNRC